MIRDDYQIASQRQFKTAPDRHPVHCGDHRLSEGEILGETGKASGPMVCIHRFPVCRRIEIPARGEKTRSRTGNDGDLKSGVLFKPGKHLIQAVTGNTVDGVGLGPVQGNQKHRSLLLGTYGADCLGNSHRVNPSVVVFLLDGVLC